MSIHNPTPFICNIKSYDIHTYFAKTNLPEKQKAYQLREKLLEDFAQEIKAGDIRYYKIHDDPLGPHPIGMWEIDFKKPEIFSKIVPWYQINHDGLSVLIHPRSDQGDLKDHTAHAMWLGHKVRLISSFLKE
ncbi:DOPA 4,5-dioxygenase family protein [Ascoidea rubescens DSM 1968]|uniref:Dopa 4,5-dioxygenase n=1 Tax=Ascoidea rubescens DSM 1968 TaxID=1344418 RepID=A0A1D2VRL0_9ASCO|nr:dopa 4,5-dioxygenase [Ascoidea rubescens DSM 1968]ODV64244.1 dopa 4,5-dioxygenase [Ascoidea rubescens DSM 1968]